MVMLQYRGIRGVKGKGTRFPLEFSAMRLVSLEELIPGMTTAKPIRDPRSANGIPLLAGGVVVTEMLLKRLQNSGVEALYVEDDLSAGIDAPEPLNDQIRMQAVTVLRDSFEKMRAS